MSVLPVYFAKRKTYRGCIPGSPGESGLVSRGSQGLRPPLELRRGSLEPPERPQGSCPAPPDPMALSSPSHTTYALVLVPRPLCDAGICTDVTRAQMSACHWVGARYSLNEASRQDTWCWVQGSGGGGACQLEWPSHALTM